MWSTRLFALGACALAMGCSSDDETQPAGETPPDPTELLAAGPHAVGYRELEVTYTPAGTKEARTLELEIWYPAEAAGAAPATYKVAGIVSVPSKVALDAPAPAQGPHPVVIYSHGNRGVGLVGYPYGEHLASWGFVVVAPDHTGNTILNATNAFLLSMLVRPQDVSASLDFIESGLAAGDALGGIADTTRTLIVGHSFGAYSTLAVAGARSDVPALKAQCPNANDDGSCALLADPAVEAAFMAGFADPRVDAIVPQAPGSPANYAAGALAGLSQPAMLQTGRLDITTPWDTAGKPTWEALAGVDDVWVDMEKGGHYSFLTVCGDAPPAFLEPLNAANDGCNASFIPYQEAVPVLSAYVLGFARAHVLGEARWKAPLAGPALGPGFVITARE